MRVHLALGSNIGDRDRNLAAAIEALEGLEGTRVYAISSCYETEPLGYTAQPLFLNMAVEIETEMAPLELLKAVKDIEVRLGRRFANRWGPREIDIDLILWGSERVEMEALTLPHAQFRQRAFVLTPLAEIAPDAVDPVSGKTVRELAESPEVQGRIEKRGPAASAP